MSRRDGVITFRRVKPLNISGLIQAARILHTCGKDMAQTQDLHHWDNPFWKSLAIAGLGALKNEVWLAEWDGSPVGTYQIRQQGEVLRFEKLATLPSAAGQGIGSRCMERIEAAACGRGCSKVTMEVYAPSAHAIAFYEHRGYRTMGTVKTLKYEEVRMEKDV